MFKINTQDKTKIPEATSAQGIFYFILKNYLSFSEINHKKPNMATINTTTIMIIILYAAGPGLTLRA